MNHPIKWKPIGKDLWQEIDGQRRVFAIRDQAEQIVRLPMIFPEFNRSGFPGTSTKLRY